MKYNDSIGPCKDAHFFRSKYGKISDIEPREIDGTKGNWILPMSFDAVSVDYCASPVMVIPLKRVGTKNQES